MRILLSAAVLLCGALAPGCGCNRAAQLPPPPPGAKAEPWAAAKKDMQAGGTASFKLFFADVNGNLAAATEIYLGLRDPYGRNAYNTTVTLGPDGSALFEDVPVGNFMLDFIEVKSERRSRMLLDLGQFTGDKAGSDAGTVNF